VYWHTERGDIYECSCTVSGSGCSCTFNSPSVGGTYTYRSTLDTNGDGIYDIYGDATLTVTTAPTTTTSSTTTTSTTTTTTIPSCDENTCYNNCLARGNIDGYCSGNQCICVPKGKEPVPSGILGNLWDLIKSILGIK
jgi:hypothetical protein